LKKQKNLRDEVKEDFEKTRHHIGEKIDLLRLDLKTYMDQRFNKIEKEIERIKAKIGMD